MIKADNGQLSALVTGASSGIGAAFAERLARNGYDLIVVARRRERLEELAQRLRKGRETEVGVLVADLTKPADLRMVEERIRGTGNLEMLVNDAGFSGYMPFIDLDPDRAEELIQLLVVAPTRLTRAARGGGITRRAAVGRSHLCACSGRPGVDYPMPGNRT